MTGLAALHRAIVWDGEDVEILRRRAQVRESDLCAKYKNDMHVLLHYYHTKQTTIPYGAWKQELDQEFNGAMWSLLLAQL